MDQVVEAIELGAAVLLFVFALYVGRRMWVGCEELYDALRTELRQERCVEEVYDE
ncbi:MAG: hypothetical protein ACI4ES_08540 [Roseburia sp.]